MTSGGPQFENHYREGDVPEVRAHTQILSYNLYEENMKFCATTTKIWNLLELVFSYLKT